MNFKTDYYKILEIPTHSRKEAIKAAWRKLAIKYHPDKNPDDPEAEEKIKQVNEAYEVLYNEISRHIYDEYRNAQQKTFSEHSKGGTNQNTQESAGKNRRTYEKRTMVRTERKIYIKGNIVIKYWGDQEITDQFASLKEVNYKLNPVSADAIIVQSDVHSFEPPVHFQRAYTQADLFNAPLPQPVKCKISTPLGEEFYDLKLEELKIVNPKLTDVTKHDKQSFGTLKGEFYAYVLRIDEKEVVQIVTECFGETGRSETKSESSFIFTRKEYYHKDCRTFWSPWERSKITVTPETKKNQKSGLSSAKFGTTEGCANWWWLSFAVPYFIIWPKLLIILLTLAILFFGVTTGVSLIRRLIPYLLILFVTFLIIVAFKSRTGEIIPIPKPNALSSDSIRTKKETVLRDTANGTPVDTIIHQDIAWHAYDSVSYNIILSVTTNSVRNSTYSHDQLELSQMSTTLGPVYNYLELADRAKLKLIYSAFDSIGRANNLSKLAFAKMIVSCIQSVPYYLVVDQSCDAHLYNDEFITRYLQKCKNNCCVGNEKFGVRSPVEFISDLKGDCDTRALFLFSILKYFGYNVALVTSQHYKHAMIAVSFEDETTVDGLAMNINNKNYYLWETTSAGFKPGEVPEANQDLSHWNIALLNEN